MKGKILINIKIRRATYCLCIIAVSKHESVLLFLVGRLKKLYQFTCIGSHTFYESGVLKVASEVCI